VQGCSVGRDELTEVSLLVIAGIVGGAAFAGGLLVGVRRIRARKRRGPMLAQAGSSSPAVQQALCVEALGLQIGDVVLLGDTEAWLTGAMRLDEDGGCVACLFFTERGSQGDVLLGCAGPLPSLLQCKPARLPNLQIAPHSLEHERELYTRRCRVPVTVTCLGQGTPGVDGEGMLLWFDSLVGTSLVVLQSQGRAWAWLGAPVDPATTLRLGAGGATFRA
jgi:hypothetical protein